MFSVTTPTQIKDNPLNTSSAKNHWSFAKSPRFKDPNPKYSFPWSSIAVRKWPMRPRAPFRRGRHLLDMATDLRILRDGLILLSHVDIICPVALKAKRGTAWKGSILDITEMSSTFPTTLMWRRGPQAQQNTTKINPKSNVVDLIVCDHGPRIRKTVIHTLLYRFLV